MDVYVKLLAADVWAAGDEKTYFLSVGVDISDQLHFERTTNFLNHGAN